VQAIDAAGNVDPTPASRGWTFTVPDTTPPPAAISSAPAVSTSQRGATFVFGSPEPGATFECRLDGAPFQPCTSPVSFSSLATGPHTFDVRARDAAGNTTVVSHSWTIRPSQQAKRLRLADLPPP
jgi:large repetitive protein